MSTPLLQVRDLVVRIRTEHDTLTVVDGVGFDLDRNEVLCLVGESGSGKSVTMLSVMRLLDERITDVDGSITFEGRQLIGLPQRQMRHVRGAGMAMIFQDPMTALNPVYPVGWQIAEQLRAHTSLSKGQARERAIELLRTVGIPDPATRVDAFAHQLSGGMRQRVMIALALSCKPRLLIADEPTTALDVTVQAQILRLIATLREQTQMGVVFVTHDMGVVAEIADRVQVMYGGRVVEEGPTAAIFTAARHPYTWGLLQSVPRLDLPKPRRLPAIPGQPAAAGRPGAGCVFAARCPHRFEACDIAPALTPVDAATTRHRVACHLPAGHRLTVGERP